MKPLFHNIKRYFTIWWIPLCVHIIAFGVFGIGGYFQRDWIIDIGVYIFYLNIIGTLISSVVQVVIRKWYLIIPQLGLTAISFFYVTLIFALSAPDYYGAHKELPDGIHFEEPLNEKPTREQFGEFELIVANSHQPGIYTYHTDHDPGEDGYFFVKAYEITSNDRLSGERMRERSKVQFDGQVQKVLEGKFTIYEGSWGDKYGGRIELWFQPSSGKEEYKITERNYIVEGWMR